VLDVIVAGGPGRLDAALVLGRAAARVLLVDRESLPRDKLCGIVEPGAPIACVVGQYGPIERRSRLA
jgi:flavin-dependent dehydrogenase